jgi:hypothetical protein
LKFPAWNSAFPLSLNCSAVLSSNTSSMTTIILGKKL